MIAPETLYLTDEDSNFESETYWCEDKVGENDVKYIRADLVPQIKELSDEDIIKNFLAKQTQLPPEFLKVLHENLWNLYES